MRTGALGNRVSRQALLSDARSTVIPTCSRAFGGLGSGRVPHHRKRGHTFGGYDERREPVDEHQVADIDRLIERNPTEALAVLIGALKALPNVYEAGETRELAESYLYSKIHEGAYGMRRGKTEASRCPCCGQTDERLERRCDKLLRAALRSRARLDRAVISYRGQYRAPVITRLAPGRRSREHRPATRARARSPGRSRSTDDPELPEPLALVGGPVA